MKKLLCAMASIALLAGPIATAQPSHSQSSQNQSSHRQSRDQQTRGDDHRKAPVRRAAQRQQAKRAYNHGYANPAHYRNNGVHRGWAQDRGNTWRWQKGQRMGYNDWYHAPRVDYRNHRLRRPPYGYQWRRYEDRYVLVGISTGLILSVILSAGR